MSVRMDLVAFDGCDGKECKKPFLITDSHGSISKILASRRKEEALLGVATGDRTRLLKALSDDAVDFVLPDLSKLRIDSAIARMAKREGCAVALSLSWILRAPATAIKRTAEAIWTLEYYNAPIIFATFASSELELRRPKEMECLLEWLGAERPGEALETAGRMMEANLKRAGEIMPGVKLAARSASGEVRE